MPESLDQTGKMWLLGSSAAVLALLLSVTVWMFRDTFGLSALALGSIVVLLWALLIYAALMNVVGLSDKTQALGLPEGSIRAIIALALVGLFAVLASTVLNGHSVVLRASADAAAVKEIRDQNPMLSLLIVPNAAATPQTFKVMTPAGPADDFMKQMLTLVGTLMTAITAFYFGGRTASPSDPARGPPQLAAVTNSPVTLDGQPARIELSGSDLNNVKSVRVYNGSTQYIAQGVLSNGSQVLAFIPFGPADQKGGTWSVAVTDDIGRVATLNDGLVVKAQPLLVLARPTVPQAKDPATGTAAVSLVLTGSAAAQVTGVKLTQGQTVVEAANLQPSSAGATCQATLAPGVWTVDATAGSQSLPNLGTITVQ